MLVDDELHADTKLRVEMPSAVAPYKPFLNGSCQGDGVRQIYFRLQGNRTAIDERSLALQCRSLDCNQQPLLGVVEAID